MPDGLPSPRAARGIEFDRNARTKAIEDDKQDRPASANRVGPGRKAGGGLRRAGSTRGVRLSAVHIGAMTVAGLRAAVRPLLRRFRSWPRCRLVRRCDDSRGGRTGPRLGQTGSAAEAFFGPNTRNVAPHGHRISLPTTRSEVCSDRPHDGHVSFNNMRRASDGSAQNRSRSDHARNSDGLRSELSLSQAPTHFQDRVDRLDAIKLGYAGHARRSRYNGPRLSGSRHIRMYAFFTCHFRHSRCRLRRFQNHRRRLHCRLNSLREPGRFPCLISRRRGVRLCLMARRTFLAGT